MVEVLHDKAPEYVAIDTGKIRAKMESALERLTDHRDQVSQAMNEVENLLSMESSLNSEEFMALVAHVERLLPPQEDPLLPLDDISAKTSLANQTPPKSSPSKAAVAQALPVCESLSLSEPSSIDEVNFNLPMIYGWLMKREKARFDLVYRGTKHGFSLEAFHAQLDGKSPLIFFVKSAEHEKVFGGYTSKPWSTPAGSSMFLYDHNAFIFSVSRRTKHLVYQNDYNAVQHYRTGCLLAFGWGDFGIQEHCDQREDNWSNFGCTKWTKYTYTLPRTVKENSDAAYRYLAGAHEFRVEELEAYRVTFIP